jgi:hypothetical protein
MNKRFMIATVLFGALMLTTACKGGDPHSKGVEAGKAACECYKLDGLEAVEKCLDKIERENQEFLTDTAYTNAVEAQLLECITDGVIDIVKPIKEAPAPKAAPADTTSKAE